MLWQGVVLNPQATAGGPTVDLSEHPLPDCLFDLYGPLSLGQCFELVKACEGVPSLHQGLDLPRFFKLQSRHWNERLSDLYQVVKQAPPAFLGWVHQKQVGQKDLQPLVSLGAMDEISPLLDQFPVANLSRNEGKQILDLLVDLLLLKNASDRLAPPAKGSWLQHLKALRYPLSQKSDKRPQPAGWPQYVQVVRHRQGDRVLQRLQITYHDATDLQDKLSRLAQREATP
jgi:hypothetical protein